MQGGGGDGIRRGRRGRRDGEAEAEVDAEPRRSRFMWNIFDLFQPRGENVTEEAHSSPPEAANDGEDGQENQQNAPARREAASGRVGAAAGAGAELRGQGIPSGAPREGAEAAPNITPIVHGTNDTRVRRRRTEEEQQANRRVRARLDEAVTREPVIAAVENEIHGRIQTTSAAPPARTGAASAGPMRGFASPNPDANPGAQPAYESQDATPPIRPVSTIPPQRRTQAGSTRLPSWDNPVDNNNDVTGTPPNASPIRPPRTMAPILRTPQESVRTMQSFPQGAMLVHIPQLHLPANQIMPQQQTPILPQQQAASLLQQQTTGLQTAVLPQQQVTGLPQRRVSGLPPQQTPLLPQQQTPVLPQQRTTVLPQQQTPVLPRQRTTVLPQQQTPVLPQQQAPGRPQQQTPVLPQQQTPVLPQQQAPVLPQQQTPVLRQQPWTGLSRQRPPPSSQQRTAALPPMLHQRTPMQQHRTPMQQHRTPMQHHRTPMQQHRRRGQRQAFSEQMTARQDQPRMMPKQIGTRIQKDWQDLKKYPIPDFFVNQLQDSQFCWILVIRGPSDSPYAGGHFLVDINIGSNFPWQAPKLRFLTRIYHCNIDLEGKVRLPIFRDWKPTRNMHQVLQSLRHVLINPEPKIALMRSLAYLYENENEEYNRKAIDWTRRFAS